MTMDAKPEIHLVVTDLDNTLYDWVTFFVTSFYAMVRVAVGLLDVSEDELLDQLQSVHRRYHDSEYPFALLETEVVRKRYGSIGRREVKEHLNAAFRAFNAARDETLRLYPTVKDTLDHLSNSGIPIVGHTEASAPNAMFRLRKLGCLPAITRLYAVEHLGEDHPIPEKGLRFYPELERVQFLRNDQRKPNPSVLLTICREAAVSPEHVLYVGDSISRDIGMAKEAGACSAFAQYGTRFDKVLWQRLVRVTHWSEEDVKRAEEARRHYQDLHADVTLERDFSQILENFCFSVKRARSELTLVDSDRTQG